MMNFQLIESIINKNDGVAKTSDFIAAGINKYEISKLLSNKVLDDEYTEEIVEQVELSIKYEGYIAKAKREAEKLIDLENKSIPENIDYSKIVNLASEARQKLSEIGPTSIGQAMRISGVNPSDIAILMIYLKKGEKH